MSEQFIQLPREGERVGAGIILSLINTGGSAAVYKTWIEALELHRAVKVMHPDADSETRERMKTEARISSKLVHQNIVHVHNYGETAAGLPYLEMDFVNGLTLAALIDKRGPLPLPVAVAIATATLEALHYAHTIDYTFNGTQHSGVMHRDIKPANVIISTETGTAKLMDFGIARPVAISIHTMAGTVPGTIAYMPPEACAGGECDLRSDIYQIGLLLYECLSGHPAFPQTNFKSLLTAKTANTYSPIDTDRRAAAIIEKCMRLDPEKRYQTAQNCLADVRALYSALCRGAAPEQLTKSFLTGCPIPKTKHKRNYMKRLKTAALAASFVLIATGAIVAAIRYSPHLVRFAAKGYTAVQATAAPAPDESAAAPAQEPELQATPTADPPAAAKAAPVKTATPTQTVQPQQAAANKTEAANVNGGDSALMLIGQADILFADKKYSEALSAYQRAVRTPSTAPRQEIIKKSLYGSARCNTALFQAGQTPRPNYVAAWRNVANAYPPESPQRIEAQTHLDEEAPN
jgi:serine/threonine-protein kinase